MENKIKMLVIPSDKYGCGKFRSVDPHVFLNEAYPDKFDVDIVYELPKEGLEEFLKQYQIVHIHKQLDKQGTLIKMMKFLGLKVIVDVDDNFFLGNDHPMALSAKKEKWHEPIIEHLRQADMVTTTTPIYAAELRKYNKNVKVFPNAINPEEKQFSEPKTPEIDRLRVGIICGSSHWKDIELLGTLPKQVDTNKVQFVLCGFDTNGTRTIYYKDEDRVETRPITPQESVWYEYEKLITDNYRIVSDKHKEFLMQFFKDTDDPFTDEAYRRMWTRDITRYATHYSNVDVLLAPLKENIFNLMKSQLKTIECAFTNTALIAQNYGAYTIDAKPMIGFGGKVDENGNCLLVDSSKNHKQWGKYINMLANDRDMLHRLQKNLHDDIVPKYAIDVVCADRAKAYEELVNS